jgi:hypothetical protein
MIDKKATAEAPLTHRHSFVVRIWREVGLPRWRGRVQHTCTGDAILFRDMDELAAFIDDWAGGWNEQSPLNSGGSGEKVRLG